MPQEDQETKKWYHIANKQRIFIYHYTIQVNAQGYNIYGLWKIVCWIEWMVQTPYFEQKSRLKKGHKCDIN